MAVLDDWGGPGILAAPSTRCPISIKEPRVVFEVAGKKTRFLVDRRATYSIWSLMLGLFSSKAVLWLMLMETLTPLSSLGLQLVSLNSVWSVCLFSLCLVSYPTSGRNSLGSLRVILWFGVLSSLSAALTKTNQLWEQGLIASHILYTVNLPVWDRNPWEGYKHLTCKISLNPEVAYPNKKQDP